MAVVETDGTLDPIIDAMGDFARERGVVLVAAVALVDGAGATLVRCKGFAPGDDRPYAKAMVDCLEGLTELRAHVDPEPSSGKETIH